MGRLLVFRLVVPHRLLLRSSLASPSRTLRRGRIRIPAAERAHFDTETAALTRIDRRLSIPTPHLVTAGERGQWLYVVMTHLSGCSLAEMAYVLLHRYSNLHWYLERRVALEGVGDLEQLARRWFAP